ncbi:hypothetical protein JHD48_08795 [Sulfurimonas sp. SAG-AH-194-I05]|nr:hypothetical protein [Sulfurimonas sp. SAG-AH-194-I05]MDF1875830.1 hypothetical protein [Sulfurimonas sp. SAG-AH-194-I05]
MSYSIETIPRFNKDVKKLKKRFPKIKDDLSLLIEELTKNPELGTPLESGLYKIRLQNSSIPTGKRAGFRIVTYYVNEDTLYLVTMYAKSDTDTILIHKLKEIISSEI